MSLLKSSSSPEIITLVGSTKFKEDFERMKLHFSLLGYIVFGVVCYTHADHIPLTIDQRLVLGNLHLEKIKMSDKIYVINPGGYIGRATGREISYAQALGKPILYMYEDLP